MSGWYLPTKDEKLGDFVAIKHKVTKELALSGKYGEIWEYSDSEYACVITSASVANKLTKGNAVRGDEIVIRFPKEELKKYAQVLKVPRQAARQVKRANEFGKHV